MPVGRGRVAVGLVLEAGMGRITRLKANVKSRKHRKPAIPRATPPRAPKRSRAAGDCQRA